MADDEAWSIGSSDSESSDDDVELASEGSDGEPPAGEESDDEPPPRPAPKRRRKGTSASSEAKRVSHVKPRKPAGRDGKAGQKRAAPPSGGRLTKKFYSVDPETGLPVLTVAQTGASAGDILVGVVRRDSGSANDSEGVILQVVSGHVVGQTAVCSPIDPDDLVKAYMRTFGLSRAVAAQRVAVRRMSSPGLDIAHPIGSGCPTASGLHSVFGDAAGKLCACEPLAQFRILEPGRWVAIADEFGNRQRLLDMVVTGATVTWRDILSLFGHKRMMLRAWLFAVAAGPQPVARPGEAAILATHPTEHRRDPASPDGNGDDDMDSHDGRDVGAIDPEGRVSYDLSAAADGSLVVTVDRSAPGPPADSLDVAAGLVAEALACPPTAMGLVRRVCSSLRRLPGGALRSLLQKAARFGAESVAMLLPPAVAADAAAEPTAAAGASATDGDDEEDGVPTLFAWSTAPVKSSLVAACSCAVLLLRKGGFVPNLQRVVRGCTSALKRVAVVLVEDGFAGDGRSLATLLGTALVTQRIRQHHPPRPVLVLAIALVAQAADSPNRIAWRQSDRSGKASDRSSPGASVACAVDRRSWQALPVLLRALGSFPGDVRMMEAAASLARKPRIPLASMPAGGRPAVVPWCHLVDQHTQPGIGHAMRADQLSTFAERFQVLFDSVTGWNPRAPGAEVATAFEDRSVVRQARFAQQLVLDRVLRLPRQPLPTCGDVTVSCPIDEGTLAAGVGPVETRVKLPGRKRRNLLVVLPTHWPAAVRGEGAAGGGGGGGDGGRVAGETAEEVVMLQPSRAKVTDYLDWASKDSPEEAAAAERERSEARASVRQMRLRVASPLLPAGHAEYRGGKWRFNGKPWLQWVASGIAAAVPLHDPPPWAEPVAAAAGSVWRVEAGVLSDDRAVQEAVNASGRGICRDAEAITLALCEQVPLPVLARAHGLLRQRFGRFSLPVPARDGGLGSDQLQAYPEDWLAWRLLVLLSRIVPGALRAETPPRFSVPNALLLRLLTSWLSGRRRLVEHVVDEAEGPAEAEGTAEEEGEAEDEEDAGAVGGAGPAAAGEAAAGASPWLQQPAWVSAYAKSRRVLRQHQRDAVLRMQARHCRGAAGHYLVMDTGHGKTYTAVSYAMWRLLHTDLGRHVRRVIWVTPPGQKLDKRGRASDPRNFQLIRSLLDEFETDEAIIKLPVSFVDKKAKRLDAMFPEYTVCVVHHDHLRSMPEALVAVASSSFIVFDEGDNFYGPSQRTSMALRVAQLCPEFVIQTATPVPSSGKLDRLAEWLGLTEEYPVTKRNYLVAACNMVSLRVSLGIDSVYTEQQAERTPGAEDAFRRYTRDKDWRRLYLALQAETNPTFLERARHHALQDRSKVAGGGCFVVCDGDRHVRELMALWRSGGFDSAGLRCGDAEAMADPSVGVVFVAASNCRGYNAGSRLGAQIRQPYPGNAASRQQMEGRIRRMNQRRSAVRYEVVVMAHTLLSLLHERQQRDDNVNHSLDQLAEEYDRAVVQGLEE